MAGNLHELVEKTTNASSKTSKIKMGYTVNKYDGVLSQLKTALRNAGVVTDSKTSVFGNDYSTLNDIQFDSNNFSTNPEAALWRMEIALFGSCPIENDNSKFQIITVEGDDSDKLENCGNNRQLPFSLNPNDLISTNEVSKFETGAFVDIDNHLVAYLNTMYTHGETTGGRRAFTRDIVQSLVSNKCLVAQIMKPQGGSSVEVAIIGRTVVSNNSRILLNPTFALSSAAEPLNIPVVVGNYHDGTSNVDVSLNAGGILNSPIQGKQYNIKDSTMDGLSRRDFDNWCSVGRNAGADGQAISIRQIQPIQTYVRIYVPQHKRDEAKQFLPEGVSENIFQSFVAARYGGINKAAARNADVKRMKECIVEVMNKNKYPIWTTSDISQSVSVPMDTKFHWKAGWYNGSDVSTAMAGHFIIPQGWPMGTINQSYPGRSVGNQIERGLPNQEFKKSELLPWVIPDKEGRLDSVLGGELDSEILSGSKSKEWYQERINKSNLGCVIIYCSKGAAPKINKFFKLMWIIYGQAANMYNTNRPEDEKVSVGELILRCAPSLCSLNGATPIHRNRAGRVCGHDSGRAIDFAYHNNKHTASFADHCNCDITKNMSEGYAPMLYALRESGGGWGGSYKFMRDAKKFDAMHVNF